MDETALTEEFESHRRRLVAIATRALGSPTDADDAVQEAWIRFHRQDHERIENVGGWLTTVVGRICIDMLRRRTARAESSLDPWGDDPVVTRDDEPVEDAAVLADSVGLALVIVLESLRPEERLAFVLHDMFGVPFADVGPIVGRSPDAAKMLASRARHKVRGVPRPTGERRQRREVVDAFLAAAREGNFDRLLELLDPDLTWHRHTDRGEDVRLGANEVMHAIRNGATGRITAERVNVNGEPGILVWGPTGRPVALMSCTIAGGKLVDIVSIVGTRRLERMSLPRPHEADAEGDG